MSTQDRITAFPAPSVAKAVMQAADRYRDGESTRTVVIPRH